MILTSVCDIDTCTRISHTQTCTHAHTHNSKLPQISFDIIGSRLGRSRLCDSRLDGSRSCGSRLGCVESGDSLAVTSWTVDQEVAGSNPAHGENLISVVRSLPLRVHSTHSVE